MGRKVDFKNTLIILTSNIGSRQLKDFGTGVGFTTPSKFEAKDKESNSVIQGALKKTFSPEFLNRIDDVIVFNSLDREELSKIIHLTLGSVLKRIQDLGYQVELAPSALDLLAEKGYDPQFGARPLKRAIQKYVEDVVAEQMISGQLQPGSVLKLEADSEGQMQVTVVDPTPPPRPSRKSKSSPPTGEQE
jgi:ATP-dependent Clp protease ATP-binding subunit ClpC